MDLAVRALCGSLSIGDQPTNSSVLDMNGTSDMCTLAYQTCTDKLKPLTLFGLVVEVCRNSSGSVWPSGLHRITPSQPRLLNWLGVVFMPWMSHVWDEKQSHVPQSTGLSLEPRALSYPDAAGHLRRTVLHPHDPAFRI